MHRSDLLAILFDACQPRASGSPRPGRQRRNRRRGRRHRRMCGRLRVPGRGGDRADGLHSGSAGCSPTTAVCSGLRRLPRHGRRARGDRAVTSWTRWWPGSGPTCISSSIRCAPGEIYNQVAVFRSPKYAAGRHLDDSQWGGPDELDEAFSACCPQVRAAMGFLWRDRWWPCTTGSRCPAGAGAGSPCSVTPRTRCCSTWPRAPARPSRTPTRWPACSPMAAARSPNRSPSTKPARSAGHAGTAHRQDLG